MPPLAASEKRNLVYPGVQLQSNRWPVALIRECLLALHSAPGDHLAALANAQVRDGRSVLLANLGRQIAAVMALHRLSPSADDPVRARLEVATILAASTEDIAGFEQLVSTLQTPGSIKKIESRLGEWLGAALLETGRRLLQRKLPDDHPLLGGVFHHALMSVDRHLADRLAVDFFAGVLSRLKLRQHVLQAREEKMALVEAAIGLAWADGKPAAQERKLIHTFIEIGRFDNGETTMLRAGLSNGEVSLDRIIDGIHTRDDGARLLKMLAITGFIDGDFSEPERRFVDEIAARLGITEDEAAMIDMQIARQLALDDSLQQRMGATGRIARSMRSHSHTVETLIRRNMDAITRELIQTGDLVHLLAKSVRTPLTEPENRRMKEQLLDLCKAVPALALFAAPGGSLLLPLLAKALPFSLAPSSFRDDEENAF